MRYSSAPCWSRRTQPPSPKKSLQVEWDRPSRPLLQRLKVAEGDYRLLPWMPGRQMKRHLRLPRRPCQESAELDVGCFRVDGAVVPDAIPRAWPNPTRPRCEPQNSRPPD